MTPSTNEAPPIAGSDVRFGAGSDFGFPKPFRFFDLAASRSEGHRPRFGIRSVSVGVRSRQQKVHYDSSTFYHNNNELVFIVIPWSQVRVLAGPPSLIEIIALWHWDQGIIEPLHGDFRGPPNSCRRRSYALKLVEHERFNAMPTS